MHNARSYDQQTPSNRACPCRAAQLVLPLLCHTTSVSCLPTLHISQQQQALVSLVAEQLVLQARLVLASLGVVLKVLRARPERLLLYASDL